MVKCPECGIDNSSYEDVRGETICNNCGLVIEGDELFFRGKIPETEKDSKESYDGDDTKDFSKEEKYFNSGYKKDKKKLNFSIPRKTKENLDEIRNIENIIADLLPEEVKEEILNQLNEFVKLNYQPNESLPQTREKKAVIWSIILAKLSNFQMKCREINNEEGMLKSSSALKKLEENDPETYERANKLFSESLKKQANLFSEKILEQVFVPINIDVVDPSWKENYKKGFSFLFAKEQYFFSSSQSLRWEDAVLEAGIKIALSYLKDQINIQLQQGVKTPKLGKREGLICACCYLVCKNNDFNPRTQDEWAKFFNISPSTLEKAIKDLNESQIIPTIKLDSLETRAKNYKLFLEKA